jgi:hypothetical protein
MSGMTHEVTSPGPVVNLPAVAPAGSAADSASAVPLPFWRRGMAFGTGFGIAIGERHLDVAIVRARPSGARLIGTTIIRDFRNRPAAEWGSELLRFVTAQGETRLAATVLLPRSEVIVRTVSLPGVADKDVASAVELQIDTLHPWGDVEIAWGWSRAGHGASKNDIIIGLARQDTLGSYETLFAEAGILIAAATFSSAVIHSALRIWNAPPASLLCFNSISDNEAGTVRTEIYGESESRSLFSAEFSMPRERALALARAELRLAPDQTALPLSEVLPVAPRTALPTDVSPLAYAAAVAGSASRVARFANLLPAERRASHNRLQYAIPTLLAILLALAGIALLVVFPAIERKRYSDDLQAAARKLEPAALRVQAIEKTVRANRTRIQALDEIKGRSQADLEVLNELTRLLQPPIWTAGVEIYPDSVIISGEAEQAAPLLKLLDSSPLFQNSEFGLAVTRSNQVDQFRIKTQRRGRAGRTTP